MHDKVLRVLLTCGARILDLDYETERQDEWMILDTIAASAKERVAVAKEALPLAEQIARARELDSNTGFPFEQALAKKRMSFICEVKKASPSKGLIAPEFPYVQIAKEYEAAGADAISVLTESAYFQGKNEYLTKIRIEKAKEFLVKPDISIKEAGIRSGYTDPNYFSRIFKKQTDMTPSEYKTRYGE